MARFRGKDAADIRIHCNPRCSYTLRDAHGRVYRVHVERAYFYTLNRDPDAKGGARKARTAVGDGILIRQKIPSLVTEAGWAQ